MKRKNALQVRKTEVTKEDQAKTSSINIDLDGSPDFSKLEPLPESIDRPIQIVVINTKLANFVQVFSDSLIL